MPVAIVTGASSGIGRAAASALAAAGHDVGLTTRRNARGAQAACREVRRLGRRAAWSAQDFADPGGAARAVEHLAGELGGVDVLVNNAGANRRCPALDESVDSFRWVLDVDLVSVFACARAAARLMVEGGGGCVVNVSSVLAHAPLHHAAAYCAAKAGVDMLTRVLALEWAPHGVRVNAVAPGHTVTPMNFAEPLPAARGCRRPEIPLGRPAEADEIAAAIVFLASATYVTGQALVVDGGLLQVTGPVQLERAHAGTAPSAARDRPAPAPEASGTAPRRPRTGGSA